MFNSYQNSQHFMMLSINLFSALSIQEQVKFLENVKHCIEDIKDLYEKNEFGTVISYSTKLYDLLENKESNNPDIQKVLNTLRSTLEYLKSIRNE